jgi:hypothetical protein
VRAAAVLALAALQADSPFVRPGVPHPAVDQIYWVPTLAQAERAAKETGRLVFAVGVVGDGNAWANGMIHEENRAFVQDLFGMVKPLADRYVGVRLDYYAQREAWKGELWKGLGGAWGMACQAVVGPDRRILVQGRCHKNGNGLTPKELLELAGPPGRKSAFRLSWFLMDADFFREDATDPGARERFAKPENQVQEARRQRKPLCRVDGAALAALEADAEFLERHARQFVWAKGDPKGPARLSVYDPHELGPDKSPALLGELALSDSKALGAALDACWRKYMARRPSNVDFMTFAEDVKPKCRETDEAIRKLAASGKLLAPGGRALLAKR